VKRIRKKELFRVSARTEGSITPKKGDATGAGKCVKKHDLEERLIDSSVRITNVLEALPGTQTGNHITG